uniref:SH3 domain-containing protein n=1 Tax=Callorhinchus milii TaxID=7868 RepID=A0A4W3IVA8_CALMI
MAKALYDNRAETADELAFRKGDILTVIEQNVKGNAGWWRCSLHGRQGIAPGNRLQLLANPKQDEPPTYVSHYLSRCQSTGPNIYQVPSTTSFEAPSNFTPPHPPHPNTLFLYFTPSHGLPLLPPVSVLLNGAISNTVQINSLYLTGNKVGDSMGGSGELTVYFAGETQGPLPTRGDEEKFLRYVLLVPRQVYDVPPSVCRDGPTRNGMYDIPAPCTLPSPCKPDWSNGLLENNESKERRASVQALYDVPVPHTEATVSTQASYDTPPTKYSPLWADRPDFGTAINRLEAGTGYNTPHTPAKYGPALAREALYDIPTSREQAKSPSRNPGIYDIPVNNLKATQDPRNIYDIPTATASQLQVAVGQERPLNASNNGVRVLEVPLQASRDLAKFSQEKTESPETSASPTRATPSTAPPIAAAPKLAQEITLDLDSAIERLVKLQQRVADSVASMMAFVSSKWRLLEHLEQHIEEIRLASQKIMESLGALMGFVKGVRVNSARLTDCNVQNRLCKQLQILEDSHHIMVETSQALHGCQWSLSALVVSQPQANPDSLDRFVMVTRTVPEDVKRLLSIIIANGKLLFKRLEKPEDNKPEETSSPTKQPVLSYHLSLHRRCNGNYIGQRGSLSISPNKDFTSKPSVMPRFKRTQTEDCDYVHLQRKEEFELEQKKESIREKKPPPATQVTLLMSLRFCLRERLLDSGKKGVTVWVNLVTHLLFFQPKDVKANKLVEGNRLSQKEGRSASSSSEHCRMFLNALHKAIVSFNGCMDGGQPPEALIKHSKVIIMIGQKLVDMMCRESEAKEVHKEVLSTSNQFCNVLKNLAMATKRAVVQPNATAGHEIREHVVEISQHAEHFRALLELKP